MILNEKLKVEIKNHALDISPKECCGLIILENEEVKVIKCENIAKEANCRFVIKPEDYLKASIRGKVLAFYHSQPDKPRFSIIDKVNCKSHNLPSIMYCVSSDVFHEMQPYDAYCSYTGREFKMGVNDCFTLVKDYFLGELAIKIGTYSYKDDWYKKSSNLFESNYEKEGFRKVSDSLKKHDVLLFIYSSKFQYPHHIAIYIGDGLILHQPRNKYSRVEDLSEHYIKKIAYIVRNNKL